MESARKEEGEMSQQDYLEIARWFQCLSHPLRLRILEELCDGEMWPLRWGGGCSDSPPNRP
jgi:hypothetical protein